MKKTLLALIGIFCLCAASAQRIPQINLYAGNPTGLACATVNTLVQSTTTGGIYACVGGVYTSPISGAWPGFPGANTFAIANALNNAWRTPLWSDITSLSGYVASLPLAGGTLTGSLTQSKHSAFGAQASVDYTYPAIKLTGPTSTLGPSVLGIQENSTTAVGVNGAVIQTGWTPASSPSGYPNATLIVDQEVNADSTSAGTAYPLGAFVQVNNNGNTISDTIEGLVVETNNAGNAPEFENISLLLQPENYGSGTITGAYGAQSSCYNLGVGTMSSCSNYAAYPPTNTGGGVVTNWKGFYVSGWNGTDYGTLPVNAYGFKLDSDSALTASGSAYGIYLGTITAPTAYQIYSAGTAPSYIAGPVTFVGSLIDNSGATQFKLPVHAGYASAANGEIGYDSTNLNWHGWLNGADNFLAGFPVASPPTSGHVAGFLKSTNSWSLQDLGAMPTALPPNGSASGDLSGSYPGPTVAKINGTALSGLATGILKNTISTGVPSIAANGTDYTLVSAQSCTNQVITALTAAGGSTCASVTNAMTTAVSTNTASAIVARDGSGNFTAGTITAALTGNASGTAANVTGVVVGANGGTGIANTGSTITLGASLTTTGTGAPTLAFPATTPYTYTHPAYTGTMVMETASDTTTSHVLHASATTGVGTFGAIAAAELPAALSSSTSINKVTITAPATGATLTIADGTTLTETYSMNVAKTAGVAGAIPWYDTTTSESATALLTQYGVMIGGGASAAPSTIAASITTTQALFATATAPAFRVIAYTDLPTGTAANQVVLGGAIAAGGPTGGATSIPVITYNAAGQLTTVTTATPTVGTVQGGAAGEILYQSAANTTGFTGAGTAGQTTFSGGTGAPTFGDLWMPEKIVPASCNNATAGNGMSLPTANAPTPFCRTGTYIQTGYLQFTGGTTSQSAQFQTEVPADVDTAAVPYVRLNYTQGTDTTNGHVIAMQVQSVCGGTTDDIAWPTATAFPTTTPSSGGATNDQYTVTVQLSAANFPAACAAGVIMNFNISTVTTTNTNTTVNLQMVTITWPEKTPGVAEAN